MPYLGVDDYYRRVQEAKSRKSVNTRKKLLKELIPQTQKQQWQEAFDGKKVYFIQTLKG
jgi:hypothetical protein